MSRPVRTKLHAVAPPETPAPTAVHEADVRRMRETIER
jgi:hypothetical protein